jgi:hypothetical protein
VDTNRGLDGDDNVAVTTTIPLGLIVSMKAATDV